MYRQPALWIYSYPWAMNQSMIPPPTIVQKHYINQGRAFCHGQITNINQSMEQECLCQSLDVADQQNAGFPSALNRQVGTDNEQKKRAPKKRSKPPKFILELRAKYSRAMKYAESHCVDCHQKKTSQKIGSAWAWPNIKKLRVGAPEPIWPIPFPPTQQTRITIMEREDIQLSPTLLNKPTNIQQPRKSILSWSNIKSHPKNATVLVSKPGCDGPTICRLTSALNQQVGKNNGQKRRAPKKRSKPSKFILELRAKYSRAMKHAESHRVDCHQKNSQKIGSAWAWPNTNKLRGGAPERIWPNPFSLTQQTRITPIESEAIQSSPTLLELPTNHVMSNPPLTPKITGLSGLDSRISSESSVIPSDDRIVNLRQIEESGISIHKYDMKYLPKIWTQFSKSNNDEGRNKKIVIRKGDDSLSSTDFLKLQCPETDKFGEWSHDLKDAWLNEAIVHFYLKHSLKHINNNTEDPSDCNSYWVFPSKVVENILLRRNVDNLEFDLYLMNYLFLPIHDNKKHWVLVAIFTKEHKIKYYDSCGKTNMQYMRLIKEYIEQQSMKNSVRKTMGEWKTVSCPWKSLKQTNCEYYQSASSP